MSVGNASAHPASPQRGLLARHPLISFFVMAYAFSWIAWSPWVLSEEGVGLLPYELSGAASGLLNATLLSLRKVLDAVTVRDARRFFEHCGYCALGQLF